MNTLFFVIVSLSAVILLFVSPNDFLSAMLDGAGKSATLCISLLASYAVWLGLMKVWEKSGVSRKISRILRPVVSKLFHTKEEKTLDALCMNISVNLLGISGAATPYGITAARLLDKTDNTEYSSALLLVINATSLQLIPTSVIGIRTALGSTSPADIVLPTVICTVFSTVFAVAMLYLCFAATTKSRVPFYKKKGAGVR